VKAAVAERAGTVSAKEHQRAASAVSRTAAAPRRGPARRTARPTSLRLVADGGRLVPQASSQAPGVRCEPVRTGAAREAAVRQRPVARRTVTREAVARRTVTREAVARTPVRLTRRGRVVVTAAAVLTIGAVSMVLAGAAQATGHSGAPSAGPGRGVTKVMVRPGQNLWSLAEAYDPDADTRQVIQEIQELNSMTTDQLQPGQVLWVPRG
jgi:nucleoid-associated protein YgaU